MGTRSLTVIKDGDGGEIAVLYGQMDGYPAGHGAELAQFLEGKHLVNGFGLDDTADTAFNGMHCLAAAIAAHGSGATNKERRRNREELIDAAYTGGCYAIAKAEGKP